MAGFVDAVISSFVPVKKRVYSDENLGRDGLNPHVQHDAFVVFGLAFSG